MQTHKQTLTLDNFWTFALLLRTTNYYCRRQRREYVMPPPLLLLFGYNLQLPPTPTSLPLLLGLFGAQGTALTLALFAWVLLMLLLLLL